ncbi:nucleoside diphosphate kinase, mitochondrial isoform X2 [Pelmatolapia mariae]|uniref:nucleoside diphosphate kinase, mitochondrial isoform X2 n=1 Tax=Pelmatolapia mariae TaxID=158779 RepID=UPI002FE5013D
MLQLRVFNRLLQHFYWRTQESTKGLLPGFPSQLWGGYRSTWRRNKSSLPDVRERTLIAVKPDGVQRRLVGQIIHRFEQRGFKLVGLKMVQVWEGPNVVQTSRKMVGHTNPTEAQAGTVRGDFSVHVSRNVVHASDSLEGAQREIQLWFQGKDLLNWECCDQGNMMED